MATQQVQRAGEQDQTVCLFKNTTSTNLKHFTTREWGHWGSIATAPDTIPPIGGGVEPILPIYHQKGVLGCKGGVTYTLSGQNGVEYGFCLVWLAPLNHDAVNSPNRVFVHTATKEEYETIYYWEEIRENLEKGYTTMGLTNQDGKFRVEATISYHEGTSSAEVDCLVKYV